MAPERYLLLRFSSLGDVVLATAAADLIRSERPGAQVLLLTKAAFAPLLEGHPSIDAVWTLGPGQGLSALARRARAEGVTAVLDLHANLRSRAFGVLSGLPVFRWKAGTLDRRLRVWFKAWKRRELPPVTQRYAATAAAMLGVTPSPIAPKPSLRVTTEAKAWAEQWLKAAGWSGETLLAVAPGAAWPTKRASVEKLEECLKGLPQGARVLLVGSAAERELCSALGAQLPASLNAAGETKDLQQLLALIGQAKAFLGHDSGPLHLAEALGIPSAALFGPTVRAFGFFPQGPGQRVFERDLDCRPCSVHGGERCPLGHHDCLRTLDAAAVAQYLAGLLATNP